MAINNPSTKSSLKRFYFLIATKDVSRVLRVCIPHQPIDFFTIDNSSDKMLKIDNYELMGYILKCFKYLFSIEL